MQKQSSIASQKMGLWCTWIFAALTVVGWLGIAHFYAPFPADSGLELCAYFRGGHDEETVSRAGLERGIELRPLGHYADPDAGAACATPPGLLLGFAAIPPAEMAHGLLELGRILRGR